MANYGEEIVYWYLRLNGFFPLTNFVVHRSSEVEHSSECDIIALRTPYVYEEIGGTSEDWDSLLTDQLDFKRTVGVICEVKTGATPDDVFNQQKVDAAIERIGFAGNTDEAKRALRQEAVYSLDQNHQIAKLLVGNRTRRRTRHFLFCSLSCATDFVKRRIANYADEKYSDRMFFNSTLLQELVWEVKLGRERGENI